MANSNNQLLKEIRFDWNKEEILEILNMPLIDLMWESQTVHRKFNKYDIQLASLFSVKTGKNGQKGIKTLRRTTTGPWSNILKKRRNHSKRAS